MFPLPTTPPGITVSLDGTQVTGTFLLDTGSQITSISSAMALTLGVRYWKPANPGHDLAAPATFVNDAGGSLIANQLTVSSGRIAGTTTIAGFNLDSLLVRTLEGDPLLASDPNHLDFVSAPVFVHDVELIDPVTLDTFTFEGILGTNYLFGSRDLSALSGFEVPFRPGPFDSLVLDFDSSTPTLGLIFPTAVPVPFALHFFTAGLIGLLGLGQLRSKKR